MEPAKPMIIKVDSLAVILDSVSPDKIQVDYLPDTLELVVSIPVEKQVTINVAEPQQPPVTLALGSLQLRFSEEVARQLAERLPHESLH